MPGMVRDRGRGGGGWRVVGLEAGCFVALFGRAWGVRRGAAGRG